MYVHYTVEGRHWVVDKITRHAMFSDHGRVQMVDWLKFEDIHFGFDVIVWKEVDQLCTIT